MFFIKIYSEDIETNICYICHISRGSALFGSGFQALLMYSSDILPFFSLSIHQMLTSFQDSLLAYTRILYMPKTLPKLTTAMEKSIDKKKPKRKDEIKVEPENVDPAPELVDTAQVDDERSKFWL